MKADLRPLGFLFDLVCQAPDGRLRTSWRDLREAGLLGEVRSLAGRYGLVSALARFAEQLPAEDVDTEVRLAVAQGLQAQYGVSTVMRLLSQLCATPELSGRGAIAIKGAALIIDGLYEGERDLCDADILVQESDLAAWQAAAARIGATYRSIAGEAHEYAAITTAGALIELHSALPATVGFERGPGFDAVRAHSRPPHCLQHPRGLLVVADEAAIEVAVHHFAFHHGGQPLHALRTLQDLRVLTATPDTGDLLPWGSPSPRDAVLRLTALSRVFASGCTPDLAARADFVSRLAAVQDFPDSPEMIFTDSVRRWLSLRSPGGPSLLRRVVGRVRPLEIPGKPRSSLPSAAVGIMRRASSLGARFVRGLWQARKDKVPLRALDSWRSFLYGPPDRRSVPR